MEKGLTPQIGTVEWNQECGNGSEASKNCTKQDLPHPVSDKCRMPNTNSVSETIVLKQVFLINARLQLLQSIQGHPYHEILEGSQFTLSQSTFLYFKCIQTKKKGGGVYGTYEIFLFYGVFI